MEMYLFKCDHQNKYSIDIEKIVAKYSYSCGLSTTHTGITGIYIEV